MNVLEPVWEFLKTAFGLSGVQVVSALVVGFTVGARLMHFLGKREVSAAKEAAALADRSRDEARSGVGGLESDVARLNSELTSATAERDSVGARLTDMGQQHERALARVREAKDEEIRSLRASNAMLIGGEASQGRQRFDAPSVEIWLFNRSPHRVQLNGELLSIGEPLRATRPSVSVTADAYHGGTAR